MKSAWRNLMAVAHCAVFVFSAATCSSNPPPEPPPPPPPVTEGLAQERTTSAGVFTEDQATRGKAAYLRDCAACHLEDMLGDGIAPPLVGVPFSFRWSDLSVGDMYAAIRTTMPQGAPASLSPMGYVDIIAYLLQANDYPTGDAELPPDEDELQQIIVDEKP